MVAMCDVQIAVAERYGMSVEAMLRDRSVAAVDARLLAIYLCRRTDAATREQIAIAFGCGENAVIYARRKISGRRTSDPAYRRVTDDLLQRLGGSPPKQPAPPRPMPDWRTERKCMRCGGAFSSEGKHNWMCAPCRAAPHDLVSAYGG